MEQPEQRTPSSLKRPRSKADTVLEKISKRLDCKPEAQPFASFGEDVAESLRKMAPEMASISKKVIAEVIFGGETGTLTATSHVVTANHVYEYTIQE